MSTFEEQDEAATARWDPFANADEDDRPPTAEEIQRRRDEADAYARSLDPNVVTCMRCQTTTTSWLVRRGKDGTGLCRACAEDTTFSKEVVKQLHEGLERLWKLRAERDRQIAEELKEVPF